MSEDPIGACCSIALLACFDVCAGIFLDFASIRHRCTETMCRCRCCGWSEKEVSLGDGERAPLIQQDQPASSKPMVPDGR